MLLVTPQGVFGIICNCRIGEPAVWCSENAAVLVALFSHEPASEHDAKPGYLEADFALFCERIRQEEAARLGLTLWPSERPN